MTQNTSSTNILIIEDEIAIAEGLVDLCELNGYRVKHVVDGESGLAEALSGQYGLVLLDLMLPGMDGFTVCDKIREKDKSLPIIPIAAYANVKCYLGGDYDSDIDAGNFAFEIGGGFAL